MSEAQGGGTEGLRNGASCRLVHSDAQTPLGRPPSVFSLREGERTDGRTNAVADQRTDGITSGEGADEPVETRIGASGLSSNSEAETPLGRPPSVLSLREGERTDGQTKAPDGRRMDEKTIGAQGKQDGVFDPLADFEEEAPGARLPSAFSLREGERTDERKRAGAGQKQDAPGSPTVQFWKPSDLRAYQPPPNQNMVGDYHIQRGAISVLAGPPGCGKSRAALWLAIQGAMGCESQWFGYPVHCRFRTLILQNENGLTRLHRDFEQINGVDSLDEWLRISAPPTFGLNLVNLQFCNELKAAVRDFAPHLVVVDPWNAMARDAMEKDYQDAFDRLRQVLAESPESPACLIVHHLRKPKSEDRHRGRSLGNLLSGSYTIISVPRSVLVLQPASDDTEDDRVVVTAAKNNDGDPGPRTAWQRCGGGFVRVEDFDLTEFDQGASTPPRESKVKPEHLRELFADGKRWLEKSDAVEGLQKIANVGRTAAYEALKLAAGRYSDILRVNDEGEIGMMLP